MGVGTVNHEEWIPTTDSPEQIEKCLNCKRPKCNDCVGRPGSRPDAARHGNNYRDIDAERFIAMYNSGVSVPMMAVRLDVSESSVRTRLRYMSIPSDPAKRPALSLEDIECLPNWIQKHFTLKGEPMA